MLYRPSIKILSGYKAAPSGGPTHARKLPNVYPVKNISKPTTNSTYISERDVPDGFLHESGSEQRGWGCSIGQGLILGLSVPKLHNLAK